jgi:cytochrome P450
MTVPNQPANRIGIVKNISFVRDALRNEHLMPRIPEIEEFIGSLDGVPLLQLLPPGEHQEARRALGRCFGAQAISRWDSFMVASSRNCLKSLNDQQMISIRTAYAEPIVWNLSMALVGVPNSEAPDLREWCRAVRGNPSIRRSRRILSLIKLSRLLQALKPVRQEGAPDPFLAELRGELRDDLLVSVAIAVLTAGVELAIRSILACVWASMNHPNRGQVKSYTSHSINGAIGAARIIPRAERVALQDTLIQGEWIREGQILAFDVCPGVPPTPVINYESESLEPLRVPSSEAILPFGFGVHYCLGAAWTQHIARYATAELFHEFPSLRIVQPQIGDERDVLGGPEDLFVSA